MPIPASRPKAKEPTTATGVNHHLTLTRQASPETGHEDVVSRGEVFLYVLKGGASRRRRPSRCLRPAGPSGLRPSGRRPRHARLTPITTGCPEFVDRPPRRPHVPRTAPPRRAAPTSVPIAARDSDPGDRFLRSSARLSTPTGVAPPAGAVNLHRYAARIRSPLTGCTGLLRPAPLMHRSRDGGAASKQPSVDLGTQPGHRI
ncbi:MAG: hypothetical protein QOD24_4978 [Solirubrobacteraceae bacterium]|nr:hypothetical protein [Solirubrobacteraceae bacterium]